MAVARRSNVSIIYNDRTAEQIAEYLSSFKYSDVASGSSDSISVELNDPDRRWISGWFPQKGDRLKPSITMSDWDSDGDAATVNCGTFEVDDFSFKGGPIKCTIDALAIPSTSGFKATERTYTYENTNLKEIGQNVAKRAGLTLYYEAPIISVESVAQDNQTDCSFYSDLVEKYGLAMKIYNDRLVVFDEAAYEAKDAVATLTESDFEPGWSWDTALAGTYTGVKYQYTHTEKDQTYTVNVGGGNRILSCNDAASNQTEATLIALAKLNNANKSTTTMKITLRSTKRQIIATDCILIAGLGRLDGKYYVEQADISVSNGTKMSLSLRKVETRFTIQTKPEITSSNPEKQTVVSRKKFSNGDRVRVVKGAKTYTGGGLASFVYTTVYTVIQVGGKNLPDDRIVIGLGDTVIAAVKEADLYHA